MLDIYGLLSGAAAIFGRAATLKKTTGDEIAIVVTPETATPTSQDLNGRYTSAIATATYSVDVADLITATGNETRPEPGDVLALSVGGITREYKVVKDPTTARSWDWYWSTPGRRLKFYVMKTKETT